MADFLRDIGRDFGNEPPKADASGYLADVAATLCAAAPALVFLATADGAVTAVDDLETRIPLSLAGHLAREALSGSEECGLHTWMTAVGSVQYRAFGLRLGNRAEDGLLGGLLAMGAQKEAFLQGHIAALRSCGRMAWRGIQGEQKNEVLRTRVRHLAAQSDTLKAAHTDAIISVIEEHSHRLGEEKERWATQQARAVAEAANRAKSDFLANMSHEIRTPMTAILGYADILAGSSLQREQQEAVDTIQRNGDHLLALINDILDLSKIESGKLQVEHLPVSPVAIFDDVVSLMRVRAEARRLPLKLEYDGPIPQTIQIDPTRLRQILVNLVGNAVKFTEIGEVKIAVRLVDRDTTEPKLRIEVIDMGVGMSPQQLERLFQPFQQADASTTRKFGGTGLGLVISKRLAELLGGNITASSVPGKGSIFTLTIATGPLEGAALVDQPAEAVAQIATKPKPATAAHARLDCRILLAEDGPDNQRLIAFVLRKAGAEVQIVENGQMAMEKALAAHPEWGRRSDDPKEPFDVILMDMQMPVMDGYEATRQLRRHGYTGPIVALTAHAMKDDLQKCLDAGCDDYLTKPIVREQFLHTVAGYLRHPAN
ncbi:MAG: ATP-binding protein [Thermoguttaceae bacterium]